MEYFFAPAKQHCPRGQDIKSKNECIKAYGILYRNPTSRKMFPAPSKRGLVTTPGHWRGVPEWCSQHMGAWARSHRDSSPHFQTSFRSSSASIELGGGTAQLDSGGAASEARTGDDVVSTNPAFRPIPASAVQTGFWGRRRRDSRRRRTGPSKDSRLRSGEFRLMCKRIKKPKKHKSNRLSRDCRVVVGYIAVRKSCRNLHMTCMHARPPLCEGFGLVTTRGPLLPAAEQRLDQEKKLFFRPVQQQELSQHTTAERHSGSQRSCSRPRCYHTSNYISFCPRPSSSSHHSLPPLQVCWGKPAMSAPTVRCRSWTNCIARSVRYNSG